MKIEDLIKDLMFNGTPCILQKNQATFYTRVIKRYMQDVKMADNLNCSEKKKNIMSVYQLHNFHNVKL